MLGDLEKPRPVHPEPHPTDRRSFLVWAINGLGAVLAVVLGVPIVGYVLDPRNRPRARDDLKLADGVRLSELTPDRPVQQGVIRDVRRDAWTLHPNDVLGRVWVVLQPGMTIPTDPAQRRRLASHDAQGQPSANAPLKVFTTICPHLGCSVNLNADGHDFTCPCHAAEFDQRGDRLNVAHNPALRGMDDLVWETDPTDPEANRVVVRYKNFRQGKTREQREIA